METNKTYQKNTSSNVLQQHSSVQQKNYSHSVYFIPLPLFFIHYPHAKHLAPRCETWKIENTILRAREDEGE